MPRAALIALATVTFVSLLIGALGVASLLTNSDVIATPGLTALPGAVAVVLATAVFAAGLRSSLVPPHPLFTSGVWVALAVAGAYLVGVWGGALATGTDVAVATSVVGQLVLGWPAAVVVGSALLTAWGAIAVSRGADAAPKWPWESGDDE